MSRAAGPPEAEAPRAAGHGTEAQEANTEHVDSAIGAEVAGARKQFVTAQARCALAGVELQALASGGLLLTRGWRRMHVLELDAVEPALRLLTGGVR